MPRPPNTDIREAILKRVDEIRPKGRPDGSLQTGTVLQNVLEQYCEGPTDPELEQAILTEWHDLFRTGYLAWGLNIGNPNPPFFHLTERGRKALERLSHDPGNPAGYLRHLAAQAKLSPVSNSYLAEGLACFNNDLGKAAAVMIGGAAESVILELRVALVARLQGLGQPVPPKLQDWKIKTVLEELFAVLESRKHLLPRDLRDDFGAYWNAFAQQIRTTRNDAGHPTSVDPVTDEAVHAAFLIFPQQAKLASRLHDWITKEFN